MLENVLLLILDGLAVGCIYALIALGYTMVYGIIKLINFAHGEFYMTGAYVGFGVFIAFSGVDLGLPVGWQAVVVFALAMLAAAAASGVLAVVVEKLAYKPLRRASRIAALLTALGVSLFLQNAALKVFTPNTRAFQAGIADRRYPRLEIPAKGVFVGATPATDIYWTDPGGAEQLMAAAGSPVEDDEYSKSILAGVKSFYYYPPVTVRRKQIIIWASVLMLTLGLSALVKYSRMGKAMRAVSYDFETAELMGINVNRVISFTFFIGAVLAGAGGVLVGSYYGMIKPTMGVMYGLKAFVAAVLGGIGSIGGAVLGGLALGVAEALVKISPRTAPFQDALSFAVLILILVFMPSGFFGKEEREKI